MGLLLVALNMMWDDLTPLLEKTEEASLSTLQNSSPFVSAVGFIYLRTENSFSLFFLLSALAQHTQNLKNDPHASVLVIDSENKLPIFEKKRATFSGEIQILKDASRFKELKNLYLKRYPKAEIFFTLPDFQFYELKPTDIHYIGGFAQTTRFIFKDNQWQKLAPQRP